MKRAVALCAVVLSLSCSTSKSPRPPNASEELRAIADEVWFRQLQDDLDARMKLGLPIDRMPDPSYARAQRDAAMASEVLMRLKAIDASALSEDERITLGVLRWREQLKIDRLPHFWHQFQVTPYGSEVRTINQVLGQFVFKTSEDAERYIRLLGEFGRFIDGLTAGLSEQQRRGILIPRPELPLVRGMFASLNREPGQSLFNVSESRLSALAPAERASFMDQVGNVITSSVNPSLQRLADVLSPEYENAAPETVGLGQYPGGREAYRYLMRLHTSLDLTPEEVHQTGLREIERIERELAAVRSDAGFHGDRAAFHHFLKTDPRFFETSSEGIRNRLQQHVTKIEPHIPRFFAMTPRAKYGVQRLDPALEGSMTFGYYQRPTPADPMGLYYFNGSKTSQRNLLFGLALMAHELVPGHHFQIARQEENESLHPVRRATFDTAFTEGWGEYAAALGTDMGIYDDPYDRAGRLMMDMMLSSRLVVDTGMNALGWSRQRAMDYLRDHSMLSDTEIATETLRYSTDIPAQALAYKIGSKRMMDLRNRAIEQLGPNFDIREFHEWVIGSGSMPLFLLEQHVGEKIRFRQDAGTSKLSPAITTTR